MRRTTIFAFAAGPIQHRFGRTAPAVVGISAVGLAALYWALEVGPSADYAGALLPGLIIMGFGSGLSQAPMFAAAATLPADRATTGSAVLNMARQIGSAVGVAVLVAFTVGAGSDSVVGFKWAWAVQAATCVAATLLLLWFAKQGRLRRSDPRPRRSAASPR